MFAGRSGQRHARPLPRQRGIGRVAAAERAQPVLYIAGNQVAQAAVYLVQAAHGIEDAEAQAQSLWENRAESPLDIEDKALEDDIPEPV